MRLLATLLATASLGVFLGSGGTASAEPGGYGRHGNEMLAGVSLTDAQKAQVQQIEQTGWAQAKGAFEQMRGVHEQIMSQLLSSSSISQADLAPLMQQEAQLRAARRAAADGGVADPAGADAAATGPGRRDASAAAEPARAGTPARAPVRHAVNGQPA